MEFRKRYAKRFYTRRSLPQPRAEYWPQDTNELSEMLQAPVEIPLLPLGAGQHLRSSVVGERVFDVIRMDKLNRVLSVDRDSKLIRMECGLTWGDLQDAAKERGLSFERSRLYPLTASVGGLLSRHERCHKELWDGDLKSSLVSITAVSPHHNTYAYLPAPRKASGPDMRWMFVGAEGLMGVILDATLLAWKPLEGRLWVWDHEDIGYLLESWRNFVDTGVRVSWSVIRDNRLYVAAHGIESVLKAADSLATGLGAEVAGSEQDVAGLRLDLEKNHPDQREHPHALRTLRVTTSLEHLCDLYELLGVSAEHIEVWDLTRHRATLMSRFPKDRLAEPSGAVTSRALDVSTVVGSDVHWPIWAQILKRELDPQRTLAIGP